MNLPSKIKYPDYAVAVYAKWHGIYGEKAREALRRASETDIPAARACWLAMARSHATAARRYYASLTGDN